MDQLPELQVWVYTLLERPAGSNLSYHAIFAAAFLLAISLSVVQSTGKQCHLSAGAHEL